MSETVRAFARGLQVIKAFGGDRPELTVAEVARAANLSRATARRLLLTLVDLEYVRMRGEHFTLTPRVLDLGYAYFASLGIPELAMPYLAELSEEVNESASVAVLDAADVIYVARAPANRVMTVSIGLGTRFPAYRTSLGRAMMADLDATSLSRIWENSDRRDPTPRTVRTLEELRTHLAQVRERGYALVDQELELGVRSVAAPLRNADGTATAALNVSTHVSRTTKADLRKRFVPRLLRAAERIEHALVRRPT